MSFCETFIFSDRLLTVSGNCSTFCQKTVFGVLKTASYVSPQEHFKEKLVFCKNSNFLYQSRTLSKKTAFCRKVFVRFVTTASYMSFGIFGGRICFCNFFSFSFRFWTLSETFSTFSRTFFVRFVTTESYMSLGVFGGRILFCNFFRFSYRFGHWGKNFPTFSRKVFVGFVTNAS